MGAEISLPLQRIPTKGEIEDKTYTTVLLMNRILDFILRNADITDMMSLATDEGCKKWIIIAESKLSTLFDRIRIEPGFFNKDGVLYLKQISSITKESRDGGLNKQYCQIVAFFFIRLFQVVGALSLSVLDTNLPLKPYSVGEKQVLYERKGVPFFKPVKPFYNRIFGSKTTGGALTAEKMISGKYAFLNNYLTYINRNRYQLTSFAKAERGANELKPGVFISIENNDKFKLDYNDGTRRVLFNFEINDDENLITISKITLNEISINIPINNSFGINLEKKGRATVGTDGKDFADYIMNTIDTIKKSPKSQTINLLRSLTYLTEHSSEWYKIKNTNIYLEKSELTDDNPSFLFRKESKGKNIEFEFKIIITKEDNSYILELKDIKVTMPKTLYVDTSLDLNEVTFNIARDPSGKAEPLYNKQTIPRFLEIQTMKLFEKAEQSLEYGITKGKQGYVRPLADTKVTNNVLKYTELWQRLSSDKPVKSFCVARALQLLNLSGLDRVTPASIKPMVFDTKFPLVLDKSLPSPGGRVFSTPSLKSLQTLYTEIPENILKMSSSDIKTRQLKLDKLLTAFNSLGKNFEEVFEIDKTLSQTEYTNRQQILGLRKVAIKLFQTQFQHSKKVENLLKKIFKIDNSITLNSSILDKGIRGIEEIAVEARDILTDYYSNCQNDYMAGVTLLQNPTAPPINRSNNKNPTNSNNNNNNNTNLNNNNNNNNNI